MSKQQSLMSYAVNLLSRREYSRWELKRRLATRAESEEELNEVLTELAQRNWQSDERFAEAFIHSKGSKYGRLRLQQELAARGVEVADVDLPDENSEVERAFAVLIKKFKQPAENYQEKQKQMRFLVYRGFSMSTAMRVLQLDWEE